MISRCFVQTGERYQSPMTTRLFDVDNKKCYDSRWEKKVVVAIEEKEDNLIRRAVTFFKALVLDREQFVLDWAGGCHCVCLSVDCWFWREIKARNKKSITNEICWSSGERYLSKTQGIPAKKYAGVCVRKRWRSPAPSIGVGRRVLLNEGEICCCSIEKKPSQ